MHRIVAEEDIVVSEVTVTDGEQAARVVAFSILDGSQIAHQIEYWLMAYDPQVGSRGSDAAHRSRPLKP